MLLWESCTLHCTPYTIFYGIYLCHIILTNSLLHIKYAPSRFPPHLQYHTDCCTATTLYETTKGRTAAGALGGYHALPVGKEVAEYRTEEVGAWLGTSSRAFIMLQPCRPWLVHHPSMLSVDLPHGGVPKL
jgi:hypothetical protein